MNTLRFIAFSAFAYGVFTGPAFAQSAVIDPNASSISLTTEQYKALVKCTLEKHPNETKRYATYHFQRRDQQTPDENERDPDSRLLIAALDGCVALASGMPFPFSPDRLVNDWANAYSVVRSASPAVIDMQSLAECAAKYNPGLARAYLQIIDTPSAHQAVQRRMTMVSLTMPPCTPTRDIKVDHDKFPRLVRKALDTNRVAN